MASKAKEKNTGEEETRLERSCRHKIAINRRLMRKLHSDEERVLCANWLNFFSCCPKNDHRARDCLLNQMMRQLRQKGELSHPFTTHVYRRSDLNLLLDEEDRQRLNRSNTPRVLLSKSSKDSRLSTFIWRERVKYLSALEEQYRRDERKRWLHECAKERTAIQDIGVQVELPVPAPRVENDVVDRSRKRWEVKERRDRERQRDLSLGLRNVAERRQLDRQQMAEARRLQERRLHEQQLKVKERRDHERNLMNKRRQAQSPLRNRGPVTFSQHQKPVESNGKRVNVKPSRAGKKSEPVQEAKKPVMGHSGARSEVLEQQTVLRAENIKKKVMAYEALKQYHGKMALEERQRLRRERVDREKAEQEAKKGRTVGGVVGKRKVSEDRDRIRKQDELKKKEKAREKSEQRPKEDPQIKFQKQLDQERDKQRKEKELKIKEFQARVELEEQQKQNLLRNIQRKREGERIQKAKEEMKERKEELKEKEKGKDLNGKEDEDFVKKFQKHREMKRILKRKQMELKDKEKPRKELEQTQKNGMQRNPQRQLEIEREIKELEQKEEKEDREERRQELRRNYQLEKKRNEERQQKEFEEKWKARKESEQRQKKDQQREHQRLEREQTRKEAKYEENEKARKESEQRQKKDQQREMEEQIMDDRRMEYLNRREKELLQKWVDLQRKYDEVPAGQLSPGAENKWRKKEIEAKKKFLEEATEHTKQLSKEIAKITKNDNNLLPKKFKLGFQERLEHNCKAKDQTKARESAGDLKSCQSKNGMALRQAHDKFMAQARKICQERKPQPDSYERIQRRLEKVQERKDLLARQLRYRQQEIEMQKHFDRQKKLFAQNEILFRQCWQKTQANWLQADVIRSKCMKELQGIQDTLQMISAEEEKIAAASLEYAKRFRNLNLAGDQRLLAGSSFQFPPALSDTRSNEEESPQWNTRSVYIDFNDLVPQRSACPLNVIYKMEPWTDSRSAHSEPAPRRYPDSSLVLFCTQTGRKRYPSICKRGASRRQEGRPLLRLSFTQILGLEEQTEDSRRILTAKNRILERKLSVAKASALNKHIRKSLLLEASKLIDSLLYEKAKARPSTKPPRYIFQTLMEPLLQAVDDVPPNVLEDINLADNQLETYLGSFLDPQGGHNDRQPLDEGPNQEEPLVSEVLHDFYDLQPQLNEILQRIDQKYRQWRDKQPDWLYN